MVYFTDFTKWRTDIIWTPESVAWINSDEDMEIVTTIDKIALLLLENSYSNQYFSDKGIMGNFSEFVDHFWNKLLFTVKTIEELKQKGGNQCNSNTLRNLYSYWKMILGRLMKLIEVHPLLFSQSYRSYLEGIFAIFFKYSNFDDSWFRKAIHCVEGVIEFEDTAILSL